MERSPVQAVAAAMGGNADFLEVVSNSRKKTPKP